MSEKGQMLVSEALALARQKAREVQTHADYVRKGKIGGAALVEKRGRRYMRKIGRRGGQISKRGPAAKE